MQLTTQFINNSAYPNSQVYILVLARDASGTQCYLNAAGAMIPVVGGQNTSMYSMTLSSFTGLQFPPTMTAGRLWISYGAPLNMATFAGGGIAQPNLANPGDPNINIPFDWMEFTVGGGTINCNTTQVDMFGIPYTMSLYDDTGGGTYALNSTRGIPLCYNDVLSQYQAFMNSVPGAAPFNSLVGPIRIVAPIHGSFAAGQPNGNYFDAYIAANWGPYAGTLAMPTTQDVFGATGSLATQPVIDASLNRHVINTGNVNNPAAYYQSGPANYYADFWHQINLASMAYGFPYDDSNNQSSLQASTHPRGLVITLSGCLSSPTPTLTSTRTNTATLTATKTATLTATRTSSPTPTATPSRTATPTSTATSTFTLSATPTPTRSRTYTPSSTPTLSSSMTSSSTASFSSTPSPTESSSPTPTLSRSPTSSFSATPTRSSTPTCSVTLTQSSTLSATPTATRSSTPTLTQSPTLTASPTPSVTVTLTQTVTSSNTKTITPGPSPTSTLTRTPSPTSSATLTASPLISATSTASPSSSATPSRTKTASPSSTPSFSSTPSLSPAISWTFSSTLTPTPSMTATRTQSPSPSATRSPTPASSPTATPTATLAIALPFSFDLEIFNSAGERVRALVEGGRFASSPSDWKIVDPMALPDDGKPALLYAAGTTFAFDGKNDQGQALAAGSYYARLQIRDSFGKTTSYSGGVTVMRGGNSARLCVSNSAGEIVRCLGISYSSGVIPQGGGRLDATSISPGKSAGISWDNASSSWDGTDASGLPVKGGIYTLTLQIQDFGGMKIKSWQIEVIEAPQGALRLLLNCNPWRSGILKVNWGAGSADVQLYNAVGERVAESSNGEFSDRGYASGIYLVTVRQGRRFASAKLAMLR